MYKDIISYELAEGITEERIIEVGSRILESWMKDLPGFISWEINRNKDGNYTDIVIWENEESAKAAEKSMMSNPALGEWFACYKPGSISSINVTLLKKVD